jgi:hypothetical protein
MRWRFWRKPTHTLLVMRYADMVLVHPDMTIDHVCGKCGKQVGIYPSGQQVLQRYSKVEIVCNHCQPLSASFTLAPGARLEPLQSKWK